MKSSQQLYTGTDYHAAAAYMVVGLIFSPAVFVFFPPLGFDSGSLVLGVAVASLALAWNSWTQHSNLTILSIVP